MKNDRSALLVANGEAQANLASLLSCHDFIVAVDGGIEELRKLNTHPQLLLGDLDSISPEALAECQNQAVEILRFPTQKNENDLELALREVLARGYERVTITNASGGRLDHLLSNLALLFHPDLAQAKLIFQDQNSQLHPIRSQLSLAVQAGDLISLIPWGGTASGVTTTALAYPLNNATLYPYQTRGLSNLALENEISVSTQSGQLLLVHTPQSHLGKEIPCPKK